MKPDYKKLSLKELLKINNSDSKKEIERRKQLFKKVFSIYFD